MSDVLIRLEQVIERTCLSRSAIYRRVSAGTFPKQRRLSHKVAAWSQEEISRWIKQTTNGV